MLTFDPVEHRYFFDGVRVPNVTSVLDALTDFSRVPPGVLEHARQEGTAIHKTIELYCGQDLAEDHLPQWLQPRLAAFKKFELETGFICKGSERRVFHATHRYAGTEDLEGAMPKLHADESIIDIKRSFFAGATIGLQLAAYLEARNAERRKEKLPKIKRRYALQLRDDGTFRMREFDNPADFTVFVGLLNTYRWCQANGNNNVWTFTQEISA